MRKRERLAIWLAWRLPRNLRQRVTKRWNNRMGEDMTEVAALGKEKPQEEYKFNWSDVGKREDTDE